MEEKVRYEDVVLRTLPFANEILLWCKKHRKFEEALKVVYSDRFLHLGSAMIYPPNGEYDDEIIGIYVYDYTTSNPIYKQDFIVNVDKKYEQFVIYTNNPNGNSKYVRGIKDFMEIYSKDHYFNNLHHLKFNELPNHKILRERALKVVEWGENIRWNGGFIMPDQKTIDFIYGKILKLNSI